MTEPVSRVPLGLDTTSSRRWPVTGHPNALKLTAAWHAAALAGCALAPSSWPWWLAGTAINHAAVTAAGLWPRSSVLGPNWTRLPAVAGNANSIALTIDDGPDPVVTPQVLDLLDRHGVRATFFCIGTLARRYPSLTREIVARGHAVENHSQTHRHTFSVKGPIALAREVATAQRTLTELTGERPLFFRAPAGLRNVLLEPVLQAFDLRLVAWTKRGFDTRETDPGRVQQRLLDNLAARDILLVHDGNAATAANGQPVLLSVLPHVVEAARQQGLRFITLRQAFTSE
jgi:peptidoglycan/xylan/chitin deacetylase (PgdA/CDA1 family)